MVSIPTNDTRHASPKTLLPRRYTKNVYFLPGYAVCPFFLYYLYSSLPEMSDQKIHTYVRESFHVPDARSDEPYTYPCQKYPNTQYDKQCFVYPPLPVPDNP